MEQEQKSKKNFHDKYYKILLLIPLTILILSVIYMGAFYSEHQDFIKKDISLTGGTSITLNAPLAPQTLKQELSEKLENIETRGIYDLLTREQIAVIIETKTEVVEAKEILEEYLGYELTDENSSIEFTGTSLSEVFYRQLIIAVILAFSLMGMVVFIIFGTNLMLKFCSAILALLGVKAAYANISFANGIVSVALVVLVGAMFYYSFKKKTKKIIPILLLLLTSTFFIFPSFYSRHLFPVIISILFVLLIIYIKYSIPSFAVILSATLDIFFTLTLVNLLGINLSSAGIVAFLMIIGYSVDTDILLTTKIFKRTEGTLNQRILSALKTGMTMTLTSLLAVGFALLIVRSFSDVLAQIFTIMLIGLFFDLINTWITNVSILKGYARRKNETVN